MSQVVLKKELTFQEQPSKAHVFESVKSELDHLSTGQVVVELLVGEQEQELFQLIANGEEEDMYLEAVRFTLHEQAGYVEQQFSDCIYDMPSNAEEAIDLLLEYAKDMKEE